MMAGVVDKKVSLFMNQVSNRRAVGEEDAADEAVGDEAVGDDSVGSGLKGQDVHFDLMLETDEGLLTWAMGAMPAAGESCGAIQLPLHREIYLTHQGPVSGGRGTVTRRLAGRYEFTAPTELILYADGGDLMVKMIEIQKDHFRFDFKNVP